MKQATNTRSTTPETLLSEAGFRFETVDRCPLAGCTVCDGPGAPVPLRPAA